MKLLALGVCGMAVHGAALAELVFEYAELETPRDASVSVIVGDGGVAFESSGGQRAIYRSAANAFYIVDDSARRTYVLNDTHLRFMSLSRERNFLGDRARVDMGRVGERRDGELRYQTTNERARINDYACVRFEVHAGAKQLRRLCVSETADFGLTQTAASAVEGMRSLALGAYTVVPEVSQALPRISADFVNGIPVEIEFTDSGRTLFLRAVFAYASKEDPFATPPSYTVQPLIMIRR